MKKKLILYIKQDSKNMKLFSTSNGTASMNIL